MHHFSLICYFSLLMQDCVCIYAINNNSDPITDGLFNEIYCIYYCEILLYSL